MRPVPAPPPPTSPLHLAAIRKREPEPPTIPAVLADPQLSMDYWNHQCPHTRCAAWVPNHLERCAEHTATEEELSA